MKENIVMVTSASNYTIVIDVPEVQLHRVWRKRGTSYPIDREKLFHAYYDPSVEYLFKKGMLTTDDKEFLIEVGLMEEDGTTEVLPLTDTLIVRLIKNMPLVEVKETVKKLSPIQIDELVNYAILHYADLNMDRIELFSKISGKDMFKAIEHYRKSQED